MIFRLPSLREELAILEGPRNHDGQPTWTLHDPARNRFFRLDWVTFEILQRWSLGHPALVAQAVGEQTPLRPAIEDVVSVLNFASANQLLHFGGADNSATLAGLRDRSRPSWWQWLVHNYLFFRIPLINPARLLAWLLNYVDFIFRPFFAAATMAAGVVGMFLVWQQWDAFKAVWIDYANLNGYLGYFFVLVAVKVIHEFGHGLVATRFGCRIPAMGVAFLVMTPVAYTDTNEAWKLTDRKARLWIGAAGMLAELSLAAWATLAWAVLPDGYFRAAAFMVATTTWMKSILVNTSPIMRFDGYYLLSDALDLPNLHSRAFALARWQLREWLFALGELPPENFKPKLRRGLTFLAFFIWCYRLVVFTGIAIFVYHFFFKALGIVLFAVEISWFVALPIFSEVKVWFEKRRSILRSPRRLWFVAGVAVACSVVFIPLPQRIRVTGQLSPGEEFRISVPETAQVSEILGRDGQHVSVGDVLFRLDSPALLSRRSKAEARVACLVEEVSSASSHLGSQQRLPVLQAELETARAAFREADAALQQLEPKAPCNGVFRIADWDLKPGEVLTRQEQIGTVVSDRGASAVTYLDEHYRHLIADGAEATMYVEGVPGKSVKLKIETIDADASRAVGQPMLTTPFGGDLPARVVDNDLIPEQAIYRVTFEAREIPPELATQVRRGRIVIQAGAESLIRRWSRNSLSVLWREFGF